MKKVLLILLICVYAISTFGVSIKEFHCCGQLKSVGISYITVLHNNANSDCCETTHHFYKITTSHLAAKHVKKPVKPVTDQTFSLYPSGITFTIPRLSSYTNTTRAYPVPFKAPIYTRHCVFRI
ncbi:hypothetical protein [Chitinophaga niabensis]|uniref:hypothetical protein n=1 Tax=Chitinophaga niabensis TaxID=536979 RepID=UPI0009415A56|nr:hypothetical protein [Chitinophaga niabensis]